MSVVLHVLSAVPPPGARCEPRVLSWFDDECMALARVQRELATLDHRVVVHGRAEHVGRARQLGVSGRIDHLGGWAVGPRLGFGRRPAWRDEHQARSASCIVYWDVMALRSGAGGSASRRVAMLRDPALLDTHSDLVPGPLDVEGLTRVVVSYRHDAAIREDLRSRVQTDVGRVRAEAGIDTSKLPEDGQLRIVLAGRAPHADALRFVFLLGLLQEAGLRPRGVVRDSAASLARARRFGLSARVRGESITLSTRPRRELLRECDLAVWVGAGTGPTRVDRAACGLAATDLLEAMSLGVPVVAPRDAVPEGMLSPELAELSIAESPSLPELARVLVPLARDRERLARLRHLARAHRAQVDPSVPEWHELAAHVIAEEAELAVPGAWPLAGAR